MPIIEWSGCQKALYLYLAYSWIANRMAKQTDHVHTPQYLDSGYNFTPHCFQMLFRCHSQLFLYCLQLFLTRLHPPLKSSFLSECVCDQTLPSLQLLSKMLQLCLQLRPGSGGLHILLLDNFMRWLCLLKSECVKIQVEMLTSKCVHVEINCSHTCSTT